MALLASGTRVNETLVVDRLLGEGAYAEVHRVRHKILGWQAMKLFKRVATLDETNAMLDEARLLSTLGHPNIVRLFDANTLETADGRRGYFTMEYIAGGNLQRLVRVHEDTPVPLPVAVQVIEQITAALVVAHQQSPPILHRDLTLANVLVGYDDKGMRVRLSDFGLSKRADPVTQLASAQGTYAFMAPEVQRMEGYSCASDVWSLGTIAYRLLTNKHPFHDGSPFHTFSVHMYRDAPLPPSSFNENIDEELDRIVLRALAIDPTERTPNAVVLADQLRTRLEATKNEAEPEAAPVAKSSGTRSGNPSGEQRAWQMAGRARELARTAATLQDAADVMEEAVTLSPAVRARYVHLLTLWRRGVMM
ncbi:serine/threonine-protein kinase [Actinocrispum wychmicini]|uniref:non-specific serine/threonine protein kinase n=1 Tax=Actinocrispum wychmicini TaxID=1213861 RepID=A0A4R2IH60_9PSEU|nr:serine/threonine-protein kinase [Actinocrispum wychmicini]TCO44211.1 serine/threonine-protein kinase [Actinocrispum wychmicini]